MRKVTLVWLGFLVLTLSGCSVYNRIMSDPKWPEEKMWQPVQSTYRDSREYNEKGEPKPVTTNNAGWSGID